MNEENFNPTFQLLDSFPRLDEVLFLQQVAKNKEELMNQNHLCIDCEWFVSPCACNNFKTVGEQTTNYSSQNNDGNCNGWEAKNISEQKRRNELTNSKVRIEPSTEANFRRFNQGDIVGDLGREFSSRNLRIFPTDIELSSMSAPRLIDIIHAQVRIIRERFNAEPCSVLLGSKTYYKIIDYTYSRYFHNGSPREILESVLGLVPIRFDRLEYHLEVIIPNSILL